MNKRSCVALIFAMFIGLFSELALCVEKGDKSLGLKGGYTTSNHSAVAGLYFQYAFSSRFRLAPDIMYAFRNDGRDAYSINLNAHIPFSLNDSKFTLYPLVGFNYTSWNIKGRKEIAENDDAKSRIDRLGFNIGCGVEFNVKPSLKLSFEAKYAALKDYGAGVFNVAIGYVF